MVNINPTSSAGAWQAIINANPAGTTYVVKSGIHRFQTITPKNGDTFECEAGAVITGGEDIFSGWSGPDGDGHWYKAVSRGLTDTQANCRTGFDCGQRNVIVADGVLLGWKTSKANVDAYSAYYGGGNVYISTNPGTFGYIEIARTARFINLCAVSNVTFKAQGGTDRVAAPFQTPIRAYATNAQARNAALAGGYADSKPSWDSGGNGESAGDNWLYQDLNIYGHAGCGIVLPNDSILRRSRVAECGQINLGHNRTFRVVYEYCIVEDGNSNGWSAGWEGGNSKFARSTDDIMRGCLVRSTTRPDNEGRYTGVIWWDIDNDGSEVYDNIFSSATADEGRGIFHEIGGSMQFYRNRVLGLARDSENQGWAKSFIASSSKAVPGTTRFDRVHVFENHFYECGGMVGGVQQDRGAWDYFRGIDATTTPMGERVCGYLRSENNLEVTDSHSPVPQAGTVDFDATATPASTSEWEDNVYMVPNTAATMFVDQVVGGGGTNRTWAQWQALGYDTGGQMLQRTTHPSRNLHPLRGGAM